MNENMYIWIGVGAVILLMAVIGYFAEKTDFGKKELEKREKKAKEKEEKQRRENEKKQKEEEKRKKEEEKKAKKEQDKKAKQEKAEKDKKVTDSETLNVVTKEEPKEILPMEEDLNVPLEPQPIEEDLNVPLESVKPMEEDLNVPLQDVPAMNWNEPSPEENETLNLESQDVKDINIELPDINTIQNNDVKKEVEEDEDIWKF